MARETLSVRIRGELKRKMRIHSEVDWAREIEKFIEQRLKELELEKTLHLIDSALEGVEASSEPAWRSVRQFRENP